MLQLSTVVLALIASTVVVYTAHHALGRQKKRYPPGPAGVPFFGNYFKLSTGRWNDKFTKWASVYGNIVFAFAPGSSACVINSRQMAEETLGKGLAYAGRPYSRMTHSLMGWGWNVGLMSPSKELNQIRTHIQQAFGPQTIPRYRPLISDEIARLVKDLVDFEGDPDAPINTAVGSIINRIAYGNEVFDENGQELLEMNRKALGLLANGMSNFWLVDFFPPLQYIPTWFPGAHFQRIARESRQVTDYIRYEPWELVLNKLKRPEGYEDCVASRMIEKEGAKDTLRDAIAVMYASGTDTTNSQIVIFILCIMLHPDVQRRIHEELDREIGQDRAPTLDELPPLTYLQAAWKECLRWHPVTPLGVTRMTTEDQTYQGYWIPKGSRVFPNSGFMLRDPSIWEEPTVYKPERFLKPAPPNQPDPAIAFGYGRRVCPGRYLAEEIVVYALAMLMWAFHVECIDGPATPDEAQFLDATFSPALPFKARFRPRSDNVRDLLAAM